MTYFAIHFFNFFYIFCVFALLIMDVVIIVLVPYPLAESDYDFTGNQIIYLMKFWVICEIDNNL